MLHCALGFCKGLETLCKPLCLQGSYLVTPMPPVLRPPYPYPYPRVVQLWNGVTLPAHPNFTSGFLPPG
eukprot:scaffold315027_cov23-Tisochrysis_lutea.AAC.1